MYDGPAVAPDKGTNGGGGMCAGLELGISMLDGPTGAPDGDGGGSVCTHIYGCNANGKQNKRSTSKTAENSSGKRSPCRPFVNWLCFAERCQLR